MQTFWLQNWRLMLSKRSRKTVVAAILLPVLVYIGVQWYMLDHLLLPSPPSRSSASGLQPLYAPGVDEKHVDIQTDNGKLTCPERRNLVFLKGMKCATSTLLGMFNRFAIKRNLSVALPMGNRIYHNWPYPMTLRDVRPTHRGVYNMILHHAVYTPAVMRALMPADTVYISIMRQPFSHLRSVFRYFNVAEIAGVSGFEQDHLAEYFSDVERYERVYKSPNAQKRWCIPDGFSVTRNLMSHCHGMPLGFPVGARDISRDAAAIDAYIRQLGRSFELVMIVEHFYESLILLRRFMCWEFKDIVFVTSNVAPTQKGIPKTKTYPRHIEEFHKRWSYADYRLYDYFNSTLWSHISRHGTGFHQEVKAFKAVQKRVEKYCLDVYSRDNQSEKLPAHTEASSKWSRRFYINAEDCRALGPQPIKMLIKMKQESEILDKALLQEDAKSADVRKYKGLC
ncbi:hypothetical protein RRG08_028535 [Elysia crispata]|uniref:Galactose-3-O-sulfotransferase 2-like n=1 Tax=Elysia crispata TaxID=231223 RepID=A0AAE0Y9I7_9GAST|nr:hypothetical protein RRG08_028535 [Elysia crispata]